MDFTRKRRAIYFVNLILGVSGLFIEPKPQNEASVSGATRVAMTCASSPNGATVISWTFIPVGSSTVQQISSGSTVFAPYNASYELQQPTGTLQNNLIIKVVSESLAGTYQCTEPGSTLSAELIVASSNPTCSYSAPNPLFQNQTVQMSCSITYTAHSSLVNTSMQWSNAGSSVSSNISYSSSGNQTIAISTCNQPAGYSTPFPMYSCTTTFTMNTASLPSGAATNQPTYSNVSSPFSSQIPVNYLNPGTMRIVGVNPDGSANIGANVTCTVDANPPANYSWYNGSITTYGPSFHIEQIGVYNCTAWNIAGSASNSTNVTKSDNTKNIIIGVVVGVGGAILIAVIAVLVYCLCFKNGGKNCPCCKRGTGSIGH